MIFLPILVSNDQHGTTLPLLYTQGFAASWDAGEFVAVKIEPTYPLLLTNVGLAVICLVNIFNFRNRTLQKKVAISTIILIIGFAFWCSVYAKQLPGGIENANFGAGAYMPALAILFIVLGIFGINKDERLIRSAERLR